MLLSDFCGADNSKTLPLSHKNFFSLTCVIRAMMIILRHTQCNSHANAMEKRQQQIMMMISTNSSAQCTQAQLRIHNVNARLSTTHRWQFCLHFFAFEIIYSFYNCLFCAIKHLFRSVLTLSAPPPHLSDWE